MSETLGTATLILRTDDKALNSGLSRARRATQKMGKDLRQTGASLSAKVTLPILGIGVAILKIAADFEQGMNRVQALTSATTEQFAKLENQAKELGATTKFSAGEAADAMGFLAQAGFKADDIYQAMPATLNLAAAAQLDLAQTADIMSNVMTGFGLAANEAGRASDVMTGAFISSNTNLQQLGEAMKFAGPVAKGMGLTFEETTAILGLLGNAGIQASLAGTTLRGMMVRLAVPTTQTAKIIKKLGLDVFNSSGKMNSMSSIMQQLSKVGATTTQVMTLFGLRAGPGTQSLLEQGAGKIREFTTELEKAGGTARRIAEVQMKGLSGAVKTLTSRMQAAALAIAESGLLEFATNAALKFSDWFKELAEVNPEILKWGTIVVGVAALAGPLLIALGFMVTAIGLLLSPIGLVVLAIMGAAGLVAAFLVFKDDVLRWIEETALGVKHWLEDVLMGAFDAVKQGLENVVGFFRDAFNAIVGNSIVPDMVDGVIAEFERMGESMSAFVEDGALEAAEALGELATSMPLDELIEMERLLQNVGDGFDRIEEANPFGDVGGAAADFGTGVGGSVAGVGGAIAGGQAFGPAGAIAGFLEEMLLRNEAVQAAFERLNVALDKAFAPIAEAFIPLIDAMIPLLEQLNPAIRALAFSITVRLAPLIKAMEEMNSIIGNLIDALDKLGINQERLEAEFDRWGEKLDAIGESILELPSALGDLAESMIDSFGEAVADLPQKIADAIAKAFSKLGGKAGDFFADVFGFQHGGVVGRDDLLTLPGMAPDSGLAVLHEGETVIPAAAARQITIELSGDDDAFFSRARVRTLVEAIRDELADDSTGGPGAATLELAG